jgi:hypothetical protein
VTLRWYREDLADVKHDLDSGRYGAEFRRLKRRHMGEGDFLAIDAPVLRRDA